MWRRRLHNWDPPVSSGVFVDDFTQYFDTIIRVSLLRHWVLLSVACYDPTAGLLCSFLFCFPFIEYSPYHARYSLYVTLVAPYMCA